MRRKRDLQSRELRSPLMAQMAQTGRWQCSRQISVRAPTADLAIRAIDPKQPRGGAKPNDTTVLCFPGNGFSSGEIFVGIHGGALISR